MDETKPQLRVALIGYGRMGREIDRLAGAHDVEITARCDAGTLLAGALLDCDVAIEFTHSDAVVGNVTTLVQAGIPVVVGTTGWNAHIDEVQRLTDRHAGRVVVGSNFSIGVNIFFQLVRAAGRLANLHAEYDVAVHEVHHVRKADAPSGTAITAAHILLAELERKTAIDAETPHGRIDPAHLHVSSQRLGETIGTHTVALDSAADTIELVHRAKDRSGFAIGALTAARWIVEQPPGLYRFEDLFA